MTIIGSSLQGLLWSFGTPGFAAMDNVQSPRKWMLGSAFLRLGQGGCRRCWGFLCLMWSFHGAYIIRLTLFEHRSMFLLLLGLLFRYLLADALTESNDVGSIER